MVYQLFDPVRLAVVCRTYSIRKLALFGFVRVGTDRPESDVDLLVEFEPGHAPGLLRLAAIEVELSQLLDGRPVDLRTAADLSRYFRDAVVQQAVVQYAA